MKRSLLLYTIILLAPSVQAQSLDTANERPSKAAENIFDVPGSTNTDPNETLEYLDALFSMTGDTLERLHAEPGVSWQEAYRALRNHTTHSLLQADSTTRFHLRMRGSSALDPFTEAGYNSGTYLGGPEALYNRLTVRSSTIDVAALEQKQTWEPSFTDHLSGFAQLHNPIPISASLALQKAVIGNYALAIGNGLLFGGSLASSARLHGASFVEERSCGLRGSITTSRKDLAGGAAELSLGPSNFIFFVSDRSFDATVKNDTIRTISQSSIHNTQAQLETEGAATAKVIGARAELKTLDTARLYCKAGVSAYDLRYNLPYLGTTSNPFLGRELEMAGADLLTISGAWTGIAESAISMNDTSRNIALLLSTIFEPADHVALSLLYRHIPYRFLSPFGEISGQSLATTSDFDGYYFGIELTPMSSEAMPNRLRISAYSDLENELVPQGYLFGKQRHDYFLSSTYRATNALELTGTLRDQENANVVSDTAASEYITLQGQTLNARLEATYRGSKATFRTRYEHVSYGLSSVLGSSSEGGWQASEELEVKVPIIRTNFTISISRFQTASSKSSVWSYEPSSPGVAAIEQLYGLGWRVNLRDRTRISEGFSVSASLAGTLYDVPHTIGSGLTAHTGSSDFTATLQLDFRL